MAGSVFYLAKSKQTKRSSEGKAGNMHIAQRKHRITGTGTKDKTAVMGILERGGKVALP